MPFSTPIARRHSGMTLRGFGRLGQAAIPAGFTYDPTTGLYLNATRTQMYNPSVGVVAPFTGYSATGPVTYTGPATPVPGPNTTYTPVISRTNGSGPGGRIVVGDSITWTLSGGPPSSNISIDSWHNLTHNASQSLGVTDASGNYSVTVKYQPTDAGPWLETWTVGTAVAAPNTFIVWPSQPTTTLAQTEEGAVESLITQLTAGSPQYTAEETQLTNLEAFLTSLSTAAPATTPAAVTPAATPVTVNLATPSGIATTVQQLTQAGVLPSTSSPAVQKAQQIAATPVVAAPTIAPAAGTPAPSTGSPSGQGTAVPPPAPSGSTQQTSQTSTGYQTTSTTTSTGVDLSWLTDSSIGGVPNWVWIAGGALLVGGMMFGGRR